MSDESVNQKIKKIKYRDFKNHDEVCDAISELKEIGLKDNKIIDAGYAAVYMMGDQRFRKPEGAIFDDGVVDHYINSFKDVDGGAMLLSHFASEQERSFRYTKNASATNDSNSHLLKTHEDKLISAILEIGGEDAAQALGGGVGFTYPEKALKALKTLDAPGVPEAICDITKIDYRQREGLQQRTVQGFGAMVDLRKQVTEGALDHITPDSIRKATERLSASLFNVKALLNCLRGGYQKSDGDLRYTTDGDPVSDDVINDFRRALSGVDNSDIFGRKLTRPHFDEIVKMHEKSLSKEDVLQQKMSRLYPDSDFDFSCE